MRKMKKGIFSKNRLTLFVSGREKNAHFRAHCLFWPNIALGPKQQTTKYSGCFFNMAKEGVFV